MSGVQIIPGWIEFARATGAKVIAAFLVIRVTAPLLAWYGATSSPNEAPNTEMLMMDPAPSFRINGAWRIRETRQSD